MNVRGDFLRSPHSTNTTAQICKSRYEIKNCNTEGHIRGLTWGGYVLHTIMFNTPRGQK